MGTTGCGFSSPLPCGLFALAGGVGLAVSSRLVTLGARAGGVGFGGASSAGPPRGGGVGLRRAKSSAGARGGWAGLLSRGKRADCIGLCGLAGADFNSSIKAARAGGFGSRGDAGADGVARGGGVGFGASADSELGVERGGGVGFWMSSVERAGGVGFEASSVRAGGVGFGTSSVRAGGVGFWMSSARGGGVGF